MGQLAAMLIEPGQTLYLDAGTSLFEVAKAVAASRCFNLTVVTNDFSISHYLMDMPHITLYHTGGLVDQRNRSSIGKSAASFLRTINIDVAFLSSSSWDTERGMSTPSEGKPRSRRRCSPFPGVGYWSAIAVNLANTACSISAGWSN